MADPEAAPRVIERTVAQPEVAAPAPGPQFAHPPPAPAQAPEPQPAEPVQGADVEEEDTAPPQNRQARRNSLWMFVLDPTEAALRGVTIAEPYVLCRLGCKNKNGSGQLSFSAPSTGLVSRHLRTYHAPLLERFKACKKKGASWNDLEETIASLDEETVEKFKKARRQSDSFWKKSDPSGVMDGEAVGQLLLLLWSVSNGVSRLALNDPILDAYHKHIGATPPSNRHTLQDQYLPILDQLVVRNYVTRLKKAASVCLMADGWRDLVRRDWIDAGVQWIEEIADGSVVSWGIAVVHLDLIFVPGSATSEAIHDLIANSVDEFVRRSLNHPHFY
jgi:hypothetical protein